MSHIFVPKLDVDMTVSILLLCSVAISKTAIAFLEGKVSANIPGAMLFYSFKYFLNHSLQVAMVYNYIFIFF